MLPKSSGRGRSMAAEILVVTSAIRALLREERPVIRSDGKFVRDYFYVKDGAAAYCTLAEQMALYTYQQGIAHRQFKPEEIFPKGIMTKVVI